MPTVNDSAGIQPYTPRVPTRDPDAMQRYLLQELQNISASITSIYKVCVELEARIASLGG